MIVETCRQYQKDKQCIVDASLLNLGVRCACRYDKRK